MAQQSRFQANIIKGNTLFDSTPPRPAHWQPAFGTTDHASPRNTPRTLDEHIVPIPPTHYILADARRKKGLTLQEVSDMCGINIRQYQKFESGERDFKGCAFSLGLRICKVLDLDPFIFIR